jgi:peptide/nickel transport system substrate-binding protein
MLPDPKQPLSIDRRSMLARMVRLGMSVPALELLARGAGSERALAAMRRTADQDVVSGTRGGNLRVVTAGEPPTLDVHQTTAGITSEIGYNICETLFTFDAQYQIIPMLAASHTISADGLMHRIVLRQGVPFHNGEVMTADDVIASIQRWGQISGVGKRMLAATSELARIDDHTIEFRLTQPFGTIPVALGQNAQGCVIYPKSAIDNGTLEPLNEIIGTGPYTLADWKADAYIRLARFEEYAALPGAPDGYGGHKYQYVDTMSFIPAPDEAARVAGLQAGDYEVAAQLTISNDQYAVLKDAEGVIAEISQPTNWDVIYLNWKSPLIGKLAMREAIQAALDHLPILLSARGGEEFIRLDPGLMMLQTPWHSSNGQDRYNMNDPDLAKQKLLEADYDGTPIRFLTSQEYSFMYGSAIVVKQQLEAVGMTIDLQVSDWATVVEQRVKPDAWDMFTSAHGFVPDPMQITIVGQMNQFPGWWNSEASLALASQLAAESEFEVRYPIWEQIQGNVYTEIPAIKIGDSSECTVRRDNVGGWTPQTERAIMYWNLWLK